jgi:hypothetical protein
MKRKLNIVLCIATPVVFGAAAVNVGGLYGALAAGLAGIACLVIGIDLAGRV